MYNVNTGMVPPYIQDLIPPLVSEVSDYPLRNTRNITVPYNRTSISQKSCIPSSIRLWNSLADDLKDSSSLLTFKKHIISKIVSEYDQEIPQSQTADNPLAPRGGAAQMSMKFIQLKL